MRPAATYFEVLSEGNIKRFDCYPFGIRGKSSLSLACWAHLDAALSSADLPDYEGG